MVLMSCITFFFQAEDGIRYLVRSRGLGDVYKRQYYYSFYKDFLGFQLGADVDVIQSSNAVDLGSVQVYRVAANSTKLVTTQGFSIGANYFFWKFFAVNANYSWNKLNTVEDDPIIPAFNTPEHKYNLGPVSYTHLTLPTSDLV